MKRMNGLLMMVGLMVSVAYPQEFSEGEQGSAMSKIMKGSGSLLLR